VATLRLKFLELFSSKIIINPFRRIDEKNKRITTRKIDIIKNNNLLVKTKNHW